MGFDELDSLLGNYDEVVFARNRCLSYMWLGRKYTSDEHKASVVPEQYIENFKINAQCAGIPVFIWIDSDLTDEQTLKQFQDLEQSFGNVTLRDLNDIPLYKDLDVFNAFHSEPMWFRYPFWGRVDLAKLLVAEYLLDDFESSFFADFDILYTKVNDPQALVDLDMFGFVLGRCDHYSDGTYAIENNWFGVSRSGRATFIEKGIEPTIRAARSCSDGYNVFACLAKEMYAQGGLMSVDGLGGVFTREIDGPNSEGIDHAASFSGSKLDID